MITDVVMWVLQGAVVAAVAALLVRVLPRLNAATRHVIWWIALVMVVVHPWTPVNVTSPSVLTTAGAAAAGSRLLVLQSPPAWAVGAALLVWLSVVSLRLVQVVRGGLLVRRLKQESRPLGAEREHRLEMWNSVRQAGRRPALRVSSRVSGPCALGLGRPMILLPEALAGVLSDEELDQIVLHEHAHLMRYDDWSRLLQSLVASVIGLHPALWFIGRQIDLEREAACDDDVVSRTRAPRQYAGCLARAAAAVLESERYACAVIPAATGSSAALRTRITRLLDDRHDRAPRLRWIAAVLSGVALAMAVVGSDHIPPLVAFIDVHPDVPSPSDYRESRVAPLRPLSDAAPMVPGRAPRRPARARLSAAVAVSASPQATRGDEGTAVAASPLSLIDRRVISLDAEALLVAPVERTAPPPVGATPVRTGQLFRMIGGRAARVGTAAADRARGLGEAVSSSVVTAANRAAQKF